MSDLGVSYRHMNAPGSSMGSLQWG